MKLMSEQIREQLIKVYENCGIYKPQYIREPIQNALAYIAQLEVDLDKAEIRIKLLEGAIERQNNTISYLSSTNGQGFNW